MKRILRRIIGFVNLAMAILLVLSFLSPHVSPEKSWIPSFLGLAFPYFLLLNVVFMLFWIVMKKPEFLLSFLAILFGWNTLKVYFSPHPAAFLRKGYYEVYLHETRHKEGSLKVISYNVRGFDRFRWSENSGAGEEMLQYLMDEDPDIICLQEFYRTETGRMSTSKILNALGETPYQHMEFPAGNRMQNYGLALFCKYPMVNRGRIDLESGTSTCCYADILFREDTLRVYNLHLQSTRLSSQRYGFLDSLKLRYDDQQMEEFRDLSIRLRYAFVKRAAQADIVKSHMENCPYPLILCGDFNDTPVSYTYRTIRKGLQDVFAEAGWGVGRTYVGRFPSFRIDYIFCSDAFEALHFNKKKLRLSDHYPVTGFLHLP